MNKIYFILMVFSWAAHAQVEYYSKKNREIGLTYFKEQVYRICQVPKVRQGLVPAIEMKDLAQKTIQIVNENFSRAFAENPDIKINFEKDAMLLSHNPICQRDGNNCRANLMATALYYYQQLRADIPDCQGYTKKDPDDPTSNTECEVELKYRKSNLQSVPNSYGVPGPSTYKKELIAIKNNVTIQLFDAIIHKGKNELHICEQPKSGVAYRYNLELDKEGEFMEGISPFHELAFSSSCHEEKTVLMESFIPIDFDKGRSTVGADQVTPLKESLVNYMLSNGDVMITDVSVLSSTSKTPFYISNGKRKIIDPKSNERNLSLAKQRVDFINKIFGDVKKKSEFSKVKFEAKAIIAGPDFSPTDLNDRFVTQMTPGYSQRIETMFKQHQSSYFDVALKKNYEDLMDEKQYVNMFQAKFKPFLGFKLTVSGYKKNESKCLMPSTSGGKKSKASKQ